MSQLLHPSYPDFHGGAILAPPIPPTSGLYVGLDDHMAVQQNNDLRDYVTTTGNRTGQSLAIPIRNQGRYGACTGFAGTAVRAALAARYHLERGEGPEVGDTPSARYAYLKTRILDGDPNVDQGATMESACRVYPLYGVSPARFDPWSDAAAATGDLTWLNHAPTAEAEAGALFFGASGYARLSGTGTSLLASILQCLADGYPPLIAFGVPQSFMSTGTNGRVPTPGTAERSQGGHANSVFGSFADQSFPGGGCILIMNSWGTGWGQNGWGYMPWSWFMTKIPGQSGYWMGEAWTVR